MAAPLASSLDVQGAALQLRAQRAQVLASNLANADTPGYKARDFDFAQALQAATGTAAAGAATALARTAPGHQSAVAGAQGAPSLLYRAPMQAALDGNSVEPDVERAAFVENSLRYQAGLKFMTGQIKQMLSAISGQ
jgi:flagellar basal-body rod protein FlgB